MNEYKRIINFAVKNNKNGLLPSQGEIAKRCHMARSEASRVMSALVDEGVLKKKGAKHCAQFYIVDADNISTKQRLRSIINSAFDICKTV